MTNSDTNVPVNNKKDQKAHNVTSWSYDMKGHAEKYAQRHFELAHKSPAQLHNVATPCRDDHLKYDFDTVGEFGDVCTQIAFKCLYHALLGRPDILWAGNLLARGVHMEQGMRQNINQTKQLHGLHPQAQRILPCRKQSD